jgi:uncharacterized protein YggE
MYISVNGVGTSMVVPDAVRFVASVSVIADSNKDALATASNSANAVRAALNKQAIASKDITTSSLIVSPEYNYSQEKGQQLIGYRAIQSLTIVVRNVESAGVVIDAVVDAGGKSLQINEVSPFLANGATATEKARKAAVTDAKTKANSYANYLGTSIDKVIDFIEISAPTYAFPTVAIPGKVELSDATQIDVGTTEVIVNVKIRWRLKDIKPKSK